MNCPKCNAETVRTGIAENIKEGETYRRYSCEMCGNVFFTVEFEVETTEQFFDSFFNHISYERRGK